MLIILLRNNQLVFITQLLNEVAKKSNVRINSFSPILKADSSKLCKKSTIQKQSKNLNLNKKIKIHLRKDQL